MTKEEAQSVFMDPVKLAQKKEEYSTLDDQGLEDAVILATVKITKLQSSKDPCMFSMVNEMVKFALLQEVATEKAAHK